MAVIKYCGSLQPPLLCGSDASLSGSDSEESVFSGLEDSGSDSSEDYDEGVDGADCEKDAKRTEETSEEQAQVGEWGASTSSFPWCLQEPGPLSIFTVELQDCSFQPLVCALLRTVEVHMPVSLPLPLRGHVYGTVG